MKDDLIALIAAVAVLCTFAFLCYHHGETVERAKWQAQVVKAQKAASAAEAQHVKDLNVVATTYAQEIQNDHVKYQKSLAGIRAGTLRLRDPYATRVPCAAAGAASSPRPSPVQLSVQTASFLLGLASDADAVADQLRACQQVIQDDRKVK